MNLLPGLLILLVGAVVAKGMSDHKLGGGFDRRTTPDQKVSNIRSQMQTAFAEGDTQKYIDLQQQLEMIDLESGL